MSNAGSGPDRLTAFLAALTRAVDTAHSVDEVMAQTRDALAALVAHDDWLPEPYTRPHPEFYRQYLLYRDPLARFSVVSFVWGPGQQTPIHDHGTWGLIGMLRGSEISQAFTSREGGVSAGEEQRLDPGDIATLVPDLGDIHQVRNVFTDAVSISIHVYGGDIGAIERRVFKPDGSIKPFISGYSDPALPNPAGRQ